MKVPDIAAKMAEKPDHELVTMFARPSDWTQEALTAALNELRNRNHSPTDISGFEQAIQAQQANVNASSLTPVTLTARLGALVVVILFPLAAYFSWNLDSESQSSGVFRIALLLICGRVVWAGLKVLISPGKTTDIHARNS